MNLYRKMQKDFFFAAARARNIHILAYMSFSHVAAGKWATEDEIEDFTLAYMAGGEL